MGAATVMAPDEGTVTVAEDTITDGKEIRGIKSCAPATTMCVMGCKLL